MKIASRPLTREELILIGMRYASESAAQEAGIALKRWKRDEAALALYGHGAEGRAKFEKLILDHAKAMKDRPVAVAGKREARVARDAAVSRAWNWIDQSTSILSVLAREDDSVASRLMAAAPEDDAELEAKLGALAELLAEVKERVSSEARIDVRLAEVAEIRTGVASNGGSMRAARVEAAKDTAALDLLDGQLYVTIRDLNVAGRKAIRNGELPGVPLSDYRFHLLNRSGRAGGAGPEPTPKP